MFLSKRTSQPSWWHYLILIFGLSLMVLIYSLYYHRQAIAIGLVILTTAFYLTWSFLHHHLANQHHPKIILEYLLVAALGLGLAVSVILSL